VIGSTGSVVPLWRAAHASGMPILLTDVSASRFWMTMPEAVALVSLAITEMRCGETFVPKIGAARVPDLLDAVCGLGTPFTVIGLRVGEKLHETLISNDEAERTMDCGACYVIRPAFATWDEHASEGALWVPPHFALRSDDDRLRIDSTTLREMVNA